MEQVSWYAAIKYCNERSLDEGIDPPAYRINGSVYPSDWEDVPTTNNATWNAVEIVPNSKGYRLPTEAQWEYACRAGSTINYDYMTSSGGTNTWDASIGWSSGESGNKTHQVGLKAANAFGLYDMHGNVAEWCWDKWSLFTSDRQVNPLGPATSTGAPGNLDMYSSGSDRVVRGGSWYNAASILRSAWRSPGSNYGSVISYEAGGSRYTYYYFYPWNWNVYNNILGLRVVRPAN